MDAAVIAGSAVIACAAISAVCFLLYLVFLWFVIVKTGGTNGLLDVAKAMNAYRVPIFRRRRR